jgi:hypothetical protein
VGAVHTAHHSVALRVKSVLEGENAEGETMQEASQEEQNSTLTCSTNDTEACAERPSRSMPTEVTAHVKPSWDIMGTLSFLNLTADTEFVLSLRRNRP